MMVVNNPLIKALFLRGGGAAFGGVPLDFNDNIRLDHYSLQSSIIIDWSQIYQQSTNM